MVCSPSLFVMWAGLRVRTLRERSISCSRMGMSEYPLPSSSATTIEEPCRHGSSPMASLIQRKDFADSITALGHTGVVLFAREIYRRREISSRR